MTVEARRNSRSLSNQRHVTDTIGVVNRFEFAIDITTVSIDDDILARVSGRAELQEPSGCLQF